MNAVDTLLWTDSTEVTEKHTRSGINKYNFLKTIYSSLYLKEKFNFYECFPSQLSRAKFERCDLLGTIYREGKV